MNQHPTLEPLATANPAGEEDVRQNKPSRLASTGKVNAAPKASHRASRAQRMEFAGKPTKTPPPSDGGVATDRRSGSKADIVLKKLRLARGVTIAQIVDTTGWQPHSVRGFLSAVVRKKLGLDLLSEVGKDGQRRYRLAEDTGKGG